MPRITNNATADYSNAVEQSDETNNTAIDLYTVSRALLDHSNFAEEFTARDRGRSYPEDYFDFDMDRNYYSFTA